MGTYFDAAQYAAVVIMLASFWLGSMVVVLRPFNRKASNRAYVLTILAVAAFFSATGWGNGATILTVFMTVTGMLFTRVVVNVAEDYSRRTYPSKGFNLLTRYSFTAIVIAIGTLLISIYIASDLHLTFAWWGVIPALYLGWKMFEAMKRCHSRLTMAFDDMRPLVVQAMVMSVWLLAVSLSVLVI